MIKKQNNKGFTLIETLIYLFITTVLLVSISSLVMTTFNTRKQLNSSNLVNNNVRFIINYLINRIHNVETIEDIRPLTEQVLFYPATSTRFSLTVESDDLVYRETEDLGSGFPDQLTAEPTILNSEGIIISDLVITPVSDSHGNLNQGVILYFTLTTGNVNDQYSYLQKTFTTFFNIR